MGVELVLVGKTEEAASETLEVVRRWLEGELRDVAEGVRLIDRAEDSVLALKLHPAAEDVEIAPTGEHQLTFTAKTTSVGPGYHTFVCDSLKRLGVHLGVRWEPRDDADPTGYFAGGPREAVEREMLAWIADVAFRVLNMPQSSRVALSLPSDRSFDADGHVLTPLGPRDTAWLRRAASEPGAGRDFFPWWEDGLGPDYQLGRALVTMWSDVRWRPPVDAVERERLEKVASLLEEAHRMDASLDYPWREWAELLGLLGRKGTALYDILARRGARVVPGTPLVGYRRRTVTVNLPGGWRLPIPGSFTEGWDAEGNFVAGEPERSLRVAAFNYRDDDGSPVPAERLLSAVEAEGGEVVEHGILAGRAVLRRSNEGFELAGETAVDGALAVTTIRHASAADRDWALATWRGLSMGGP
jgi:hypothetical protein